ncbi:hypothetical protein FRC01_009091 [Tulasnella sp. 417]|nr:hypothetical protein FRC01_009091 [Tulasnella sp. 417]
MPRPLAKKGSFSQEEISLTTPSSPVSLSRPVDLPVYTDHDPQEKPHSRYDYQEKGGDHDDEHGESAALLSEMEGMEEKEDSHNRVSRRRKLLALGFSFLILSVVGGSAWWSKGPPSSGSVGAQNLGVLSNGTHEFKPTVLMVSLDGLRAEYVERNLTTHLHDISVQGLRAKFIRPVFPSLTFPNHWSLMTGLYAESHGLVANTFFDPISEDTFRYTDPTHSWNASWWGGEPAWATAVKAGLKTANLMWPGPPVTSEGISPTYYVPFENHVALDWKHDKIFEWLDMPMEVRPQLITAYEPSVDQVGHKFGPSSPEVDDALKAVDKFSRRIHNSLKERNLTHIVDVIFVSDHGMVDTSDTRLVYVDDVLGKDGWEAIEHNDGWPSYGLRFKQGTNTTEMLRRLYAGAASMNPRAFDVYVTESYYKDETIRYSDNLGDGLHIVHMPERYHYSDNIRIAPIYAVPRNHGYDPDEPAMHAIFVADGPFSTSTKVKQASKSATADLSAPLVMEGFQNVEIYGLVAKLLGLKGAPTNGTQGFWDAWLD